MDGIGQLFSFIGSLGDELSNILEGEGKAPPGEWELPDEFAGDDSEDDVRNSFLKSQNVLESRVHSNPPTLCSPFQCRRTPTPT
jgi:hypothetical protein